MRKLFNTRLKRHLKETFRYLRLVFNDHFVFAMLIMLGGLSLSYSNTLKTLPKSSWWGAPAVIVFLIAILQLGELSTFLKDADIVFLIAKENVMTDYLRYAKQYSLYLSTLIQVIGFFVILPFIQATISLSGMAIFLLALTQLLLKDSWLEIEQLVKFKGVPNWQINRILWRFIVPFIILIIGIYVTEWLALILAVLESGWLHIQVYRTHKLSFKWWEAIKTENNRLMRIYRFFNLFTDVPVLKSGVKRRHYLDFLLVGIKRKYSNTYLYLYCRGLIRSSEFSGLYFRLTFMGMVVLCFVHGIWLPIMLTSLFIYLIGFQLIPFYWQFDDIVFTHIYPIDDWQKKDSFKKILMILLMITSVLLLLIISIVNFNWLIIIITVVVESVEVLGIAIYYLPLRLRKNH